MSFAIHCGDALAVLRKMPEASVHCCVTSPPYWGLRDYGTAKWSGGLPDCDHVYNHGTQGKTGQRADRTFTAQAVYRGVCRKCGAERVDQQLGLERTYPEYVERLVGILEEVRRVLRTDGVMWLNLGDSYATGAGMVGECPGGGEQGERWKGFRGDHPVDKKRNGASIPIGPMTQANRLPQPGLKPKDLCGIPWRVAFALQDAGWWLRSDIIWAKPAPMPESVTDRPTRSHEYIFLLSRSERYFYDSEAIKEPAAFLGPNGAQKSPYAQGFGRRTPEEEQERRDVKRNRVSGVVHGNLPGRDDADRACNNPDQLTRNKRDVWTVNTDPFPEAHFATFPPALILPCVLAGCPVGGTVLDPFSGAATTGVVAQKNSRNFIGIELNPEYVAMSERRLAQKVLEFQ